MTFGTAYANTLLDAALDGAYVSLHTGDPGSTGANEVTGGSYARQVPTYSAAASKEKPTSATCDFSGMPACTVTHVGAWTASSGGTFRIGGALTESKVVGSGATFRFSSGDLKGQLT
jgi:hypothetical protein